MSFYFLCLSFHLSAASRHQRLFSAAKLARHAGFLGTRQPSRIQCECGGLFACPPPPPSTQSPSSLALHLLLWMCDAVGSQWLLLSAVLESKDASLATERGMRATARHPVSTSIHQTLLPICVTFPPNLPADGFTAALWGRVCLFEVKVALPPLFVLKAHFSSLIGRVRRVIGKIIRPDWKPTSGPGTDRQTGHFSDAVSFQVKKKKHLLKCNES